jgi:hypothetical protein
MCLTIVRFEPLKELSREEYGGFLRKIMPGYQNAAGLKRKYFLAGDAGGMGIYEWESRRHAEDFYNEGWAAQMKTMAGDSVTVEYTRINAVLDNVTGEVDYRV